MKAPTGNMVIAAFKPIFDNPDVQSVLADVWETETAIILKSKTDF